MCPFGRRFYLGAGKHLHASRADSFFAQHPASVGLATSRIDPDVNEFGRQFLAGGEVTEAIERRVGDKLQARISELQLLDRKYWRAIIGRLKDLRGKGQLMSEGANVAASD
jgi:hypothetical protein